MKLIFDLDGVICELKQPGQTYAEVEAKTNIINLMRKLKKEGHEIVIYTSRNMLTTGGNVGKAIKNVGKDTLDWLEKNKVPYDELHFGKPFGDVYIDDMAIGFDENRIEEEIDKKMINIVIPMAGDGRRFLERGYKKPKYMLRVNGKSLFEWSLESLPLDISKRVIFIIRSDHNKLFKAKNFVEKTIQLRFPEIIDKTVVIVADHKTEGQAETVLLAKNYINEKRPLLIYNIDSFFRSTRLKQKILTMKHKNIDGIIGVFKDTDPRWSFVKTDENGFAVETREKVPISDNASTGLYIFSDGSEFVRYQESRKKAGKKERGEYYVIPLYNDMIKDGKKVIIDTCEEFLCFGTPDDIECFGGILDAGDNT